MLPLQHISIAEQIAQPAFDDLTAAAAALVKCLLIVLEAFAAPIQSLTFDGEFLGKQLVEVCAELRFEPISLLAFRLTGTARQFTRLGFHPVNFGAFCHPRAKRGGVQILEPALEGQHGMACRTFRSTRDAFKIQHKGIASLCITVHHPDTGRPIATLQSELALHARSG